MQHYWNHWLKENKPLAFYWSSSCRIFNLFKKANFQSIEALFSGEIDLLMTDIANA